MYIIKLTNTYFTLNFRCQNAVGHAVVVSGILEILPGKSSQWAACWHGWQLAHDGDDGRLTARGERQRRQYLTYCRVNDGKTADVPLLVKALEYGRITAITRFQYFPYSNTGGTIFEFAYTYRALV